MRGEVNENMYLRMACGTCTDAEGRTYQLANNVGGGCPIVSRDGSRKTFVLSWTDIVDMAKEAGIDDD